MKTFKNKDGGNKQLGVKKKFFNPNAEKNKMSVIWKFIQKPCINEIPGRKKRKKDYSNNSW